MIKVCFYLDQYWDEENKEMLYFVKSWLEQGNEYRDNDKIPLHKEAEG